MITAQEALEASYIPLDDLERRIKVQVAKQKRCLPYVLISKETAEKLKELGYLVFGPFGPSATLGIERDSYSISW